MMTRHYSLTHMLYAALLYSATIDVLLNALSEREEACALPPTGLSAQDTRLLWRLLQGWFPRLFDTCD